MDLPNFINHVIGCSELVDLWIIKNNNNKKESLRTFAHVVRRDHVSRARNADQTARICQRFLYSMVEITRSYDLIKHGRHISLRHSGGAQRFVGFFLVCSFRVLIGWAIKLQSRGCDNCIRSGQVVHGNQKFYH